METWTRERVIREILSREATGQKLTASRTGGVDSRLYQAAARVFGSWRNALRAAGISPARVRMKDRWPREKILARIFALSQREQPLNPSDLRDKYRALVRAAEAQFGTWPKAVAAAGVGPIVLRRTPRWSRDGIIRGILARALESAPLTSRTVRPRSLFECGRRQFGSWRAALAAAGVQPPTAHPIPATADPPGNTASDEAAPRLRPGQIWTEQGVVDAILARLRDDKPINANAVYADHRSLYRAGETRFGNWRKALIGAGLDPEKHQKSSVHSASAR